MAGKRASLAWSLGRRIVALREQRGLTQERLAWEAGLSSKGYLSRIESGQRLPSLDVLGRLASRLAVEVRDLFIFPERGAVDQAMDAIGTLGEIFARRVIERAEKHEGWSPRTERTSTTAAAEPNSSYLTAPRPRRTKRPSAKHGKKS